ncbi:MAG: TetR/AcrR family transcriptional regulator [Faecalibacterium sp.]|nr:TetR/AcrR family transcriptional regulator [Ruminococcus sp.]MCM1392979.1 TetR/AcrR family transcriptional regulator [Ruminococcus sp.]MCM1484673.1 TetR/AcrR family transcriptional regulator [Faecalibacterium sp.]
MGENKICKTDNCEELSAKERIDNAFTALIENREISKITVAMIAEKAKVSKSTFYRYYYDIYDVYESLLDAFAKKCSDAADEIIHACFNESIGMKSVYFFKNRFLFSDHDKVVFDSAMEHGNTRLLKFLYQKVYDLLVESISLIISDDKDVAFVSCFFTSAILNCYIDSFRNGEDFNTDMITIIFDTVRKISEVGGLLERKN